MYQQESWCSNSGEELVTVSRALGDAKICLLESHHSQEHARSLPGACWDADSHQPATFRSPWCTSSVYQGPARSQAMSKQSRLMCQWRGAAGTFRVLPRQLSGGWCSTLSKPMYLEGGWDPSEWYPWHAASILEDAIAMDYSCLCEHNPEQQL